jgi:predicted Ser/Thr protein kinase
MKKHQINNLVLLFLLLPMIVIGQVGINTQNPDLSAALDISSTTQGFLPPRLTYDEMKVISNPAQGLIVYCTDCVGPQGTIIIFNGEVWVDFFDSMNGHMSTSGMSENIEKYEPPTPPTGIDVYDPNPEVFDNPVSNNDELSLMLSKANDLLTSYSFFVMIAEIASDNSLKGGESETDYVELKQIEDFQHDSDNTAIRNVWNFMYAGYNRSSYAYLKGSEITDVNQNFIAEALFLKSFYAFTLIEWFGHFPKVYEYDENNAPLIDGSSLHQTQELLEYIISMLDEAIALASSHGVSSSGRSMIDKNTMLAYKSKALFKLGDYVSAGNVIDEIISSGDYNLETNYQNIFDIETSSSVFNIDCTDAQSASWLCMLCSQGNLMAGWQGIRDYSGPDFRSGFGFNIPTQESYDCFESGDLRRDVALLNISDWISQNPTATFNQAYQHTGFFNKKYLPRQGGQEKLPTELTYGNDIKVIRYAELLLLRAEISLQTGNINESLNYLNMVRNRAGLTNISSGNNNEILNQIIKERRVEFMGEGKRYFDLVHYEIASEKLQNFVVGKNEVFPIPHSFLDLVNSIVQNPGY